MKIRTVRLNSATLDLSSADLYTLANANLTVNDNPTTANIFGVFKCEADGQAILDATDYAGSSVPLKVVQPAYYPKAMKGAECGAQISDLSWANENLEKGYQYCATGRGFFVAGVLNSTQTDANDPFDSTDIIANNAACWKELYEVTFNPFQ